MKKSEEKWGGREGGTGRGVAEDAGRKGGAEGWRARGGVLFRSKRGGKPNFLLFSFCLFVSFALVNGDKLREGLLTATTCL